MYLWKFRREKCLSPATLDAVTMGITLLGRSQKHIGRESEAEEGN